MADSLALALGENVICNHHWLLFWNEILFKEKFLVVPLIFLQNVVEVDLMSCYLLRILSLVCRVEANMCALLFTMLLYINILSSV